jgi:thiamine kinase-like enzyme
MTNSLENNVPVTKIVDVQNALSAVFNRSEVDGIKLLKGGLSSALVYKITVDSKDYLLRIVINVDEFNDPVRQYRCMELAAVIKLAPKVYYANPDNAVTITDFIVAKPLVDCFPNRADLLAELVFSVKKLHSLPLFSKLIDFIDGVNIFLQMYQQLHMFPDELTAECFELYRQIPAVYRSDEHDMVSSHNDLNPNNLLFDGRQLWIIDWETAFQNDRFVDLAIIAQFFAEDKTQEEIILKAYFGVALNDFHRARFYIMQQVCYMYYAMITLRIAATQRAPGFQHDSDMDVPSLQVFRLKLANGETSMAAYEGQLMYGKVLLKTIVQNLKNAAFTWAMKQVKVHIS